MQPAVPLLVSVQHPPPATAATNYRAHGVCVHMAKFTQLHKADVVQESSLC